MTADAALLAMGDHRFVSLTTFRRSGVAVPTTVWVGRDGDALLVTTFSSTGKAKRLRNDPRVELRRSSALGRVADGAPTAPGRAEILRDDASAARLAEVFRAKYGIQFRVAMRVEAWLLRSAGERITLRITPPASPEP